MRNVSLISFLLLIIAACNRPEQTNEIVIEGDVKNIPDGKVYLTDAHNWQVPLDSTQIKNGHFLFRLQPDSSFYPYKASLYYSDSTKNFKMSPILFRNYMKGKDSLKFASTAFILEKGYTRITGDIQSQPAPRVFAGKETDLLYKFDGGFGWIGNADSARRVAIISNNKGQIKTYPFSYFLLKEIYRVKEQYTEAELREIISLFDNDVQGSKIGDEMREYLQNRPDPNTPYPNLSLVNAKNETGSIFDTTAKINMLVFWASWCGPCRMEIPQLKELYLQYKGKGFNLVSVSIDEEKEKWERALSQEKMDWPQYLVSLDKMELVKQQFNFSAIPYVVFTDAKGMEIKTFIGYDKEQKKHYEAVINQYLVNR